MAGGIPISAKFDVAIAEPFDSKLESVSTFSELASTPFPYKGMQKLVEDEGDNGVIYVLGTDLVTWSNSSNSKSFHVSNLIEWKEAMNSDEIESIYVDKTFIISGTIDLTTAVTEKHIFGVDVTIGDGSDVTFNNRVTTYFHNHVVMPTTSVSILSNDASTVSWYFTRVKPSVLEGSYFQVTWGSNFTVYYENIYTERAGAESQMVFLGGDISVDTINNKYGTFKQIWSDSGYAQGMTYVDNLKQFTDALNSRTVGSIMLNQVIFIAEDLTTECKSDKQIFGEAIIMSNNSNWYITKGNELYINCDLVIQNGTTSGIQKSVGLWLKSIYGCYLVSASYDIRGTGKLKMLGDSCFYERLLQGATFENREDNITRHVKQYWTSSTTEAVYFVSNEKDFISAFTSQFAKQIVIERPLIFTEDLSLELFTRTGVSYDKLIKGESITFDSGGQTGANGITFEISLPTNAINTYVKFYNDIIVPNGDVSIVSNNGVDIKFRNIFNTNEVYLSTTTNDLTGGIVFEKSSNNSLILDSVGGSEVLITYWDSTSSLSIGTTSKTPSSIGSKGQVSYNSSFKYTCVDTDTWVREAVDTTW